MPTRRILCGLSALALSMPLAAQQAPEISVGWTGDVLSVVDGGFDRGAVFTGLGWIALAGGGERWRWTANAYLPHGSSLSARRLGDLSVASNIDTDSDARLQELWAERLGEGWSLRLGLIAADTEFWGSDYAALFINSAFGAPPGISMNLPGPPIFPVAAAGARVAFDVGTGGTLRLAATDGDAGDPLADNPHGLDVDFGDGTLLLAEFEQQYTRGEDRFPDRWRIGVWRHSAAVDDPEGVRASHGLVALADRALGENLGWFGRINLARASTSLSPRAVETGLWFDDPDDAVPGTLGLALEWLDLDRERAQPEGIARPDAEWVLEATWALPLGERWVVQPDVQYLRQPGGSRDAGSAWVVGVRLGWETAF